MPTITSVPATFTVDDSGHPNQSVTFAIPSGTYTSGTWRLAGTVTATSPGVPNAVTGATHSAAFPDSVGAYDNTIAVTETQLSDINAAAGASLSAILKLSPIGFGGNSNSVTTFSVTLVGTVNITENMTPIVLTITVTIPSQNVPISAYPFAVAVSASFPSATISMPLSVSMSPIILTTTVPAAGKYQTSPGAVIVVNMEPVVL